MVILIVATALAAVAIPQKAEAATLKGKLLHAKLALRTSKRPSAGRRGRPCRRSRRRPGPRDRARRSAGGRADADVHPGAVTPTPTATPAPAGPSVEELQAQVAKARRAVRVWNLRVRRLARQYRQERQMARWEKHHEWMPIIKVAAAKYHVKADGMYRMMMRESGGQQYAGSSGAFKGLFQYYTGTWSVELEPVEGRQHLRRQLADLRDRLRHPQGHGPVDVDHHVRLAVLIV